MMKKLISILNEKPLKKAGFLLALFLVAGFSAMAQSVVAKREFNNTLKAYFETKNALSKDNVSGAEAGAKKLLAVINEFPEKTLNEGQREEWNKHNADLKKYTESVIAEKELKAQRKSFEYVSSAVIALAKQFQMNNETVYIQYCPMVKRSWLNEVEAVQNPFYGSKMYSCGEVTETLAKK